MLMICRLWAQNCRRWDLKEYLAKRMKGRKEVNTQKWLRDVKFSTTQKFTCGFCP